MLTTAENMLNDALSTSTYDAENRIATRDAELSGGFAGADEVEEGGDRRLGMGAEGAPMFETLRVTTLLPPPVSFKQSCQHHHVSGTDKWIKT